jgi:GT2 family glycosyltransferase
VIESAGPTTGGTPPDGSGRDVTVVVVTWQGAHLLPACLDSLAAQTVAPIVLVMDNASTDGTAELLDQRYPQAQVHRLPHNTGFAGAIHAALPLVRTPFMALLNNDARAEPEWLERSLAALAEHHDAAAVTAKMLLWTDTDDGQPIINNAGVRLTEDGYGTDRGGGEPDGAPFDEPAEVFGFSGGAAVLRTDQVRSVGGMPAEFFLYYEDTDLAWRLRLAGYRVRYEPEAVVLHRHAASTDRMSESFAFYNERNRLLMLLRCAPLRFAWAQLVRFGLTTLSLAVRRRLGQPIPEVAVFRTGVRMRVIGGVLGHIGWSLKARKSVSRSAVLSRQEVVTTWVPRRGGLF